MSHQLNSNQVGACQSGCILLIMDPWGRIQALVVIKELKHMPFVYCAFHAPSVNYILNVSILIISIL